MNLTVGERVENGAKLLDDYASDWFNFVDMDTFDIQSTEHCVLGQLFGSWTNGARDLGIEGDRERQCELGLELTHEEYNSAFLGSLCQQFADEWESQIILRLEGAKYADGMVNV